MKKVLMALLFIFWLSNISFAQDQPAKRTEEYCDAFMWEKTFGKQFYMSVDFGNAQQKRGEKLLDTSGNPLEFISPIDALNYLNRQGWELVHVYVLREDKTDYRHYVMKRKVSVQN
ncbi:hypothetical protein [Rufibacter latericius]|uniref:DUF4177 domain-containing protein n=1 Tax=Rufibacter latericius TaxID=2487040 RepID=A0A3M9N0L5_9BACT|nr:hypothetical protein [Rufibacter latericius]RNI30548.1 hypothetical protein EFB08_04655 [Rufibacter latericius]